MTNYVIYNHESNKLKFFNEISSLLNYLGINDHAISSEDLLKQGYFLLKITIQSLCESDIKSNPYDTSLILVEHEYIVPLPLFLNLQLLCNSKNILSIWNCILQQYSELLNIYSEDVLNITPFDINYSIQHAITMRNDMYEHDELVRDLKNILLTYRQVYLTNEQ